MTEQTIEKTNTYQNTQNTKNKNTTEILPSIIRAGRSAWYDRIVGIDEAAGSNPAPSTTREPRLFEVVYDLKTLE